MEPVKGCGGTHNDEPEGPVAPPRQGLAVDGSVVLLRARNVLQVPEPGTEAEGQPWAPHAALQVITPSLTGGLIRLYSNNT